jgi:hypothetical protein
MLAHLARLHVQNQARSDDGGLRMIESASLLASASASTRISTSLFRFALCLAVLGAGIFGGASGCATPASSSAHSRRELVISCDESRAKDVIAFPTSTYEMITRVDLPSGEHHPLRVRFQAAAPGALAITLYQSTPLETPGDAIVSVPRSLDPADISDGKDGRWVVEDLVDAKPLQGVIWIGVRKVSGQPTLWSSGGTSGQSFIRNNDPQNLMDLLPTKRSPMLRLELAP